MKKRWLGTIAALAVAALAVGAVPALTADSGTVTVTITAQAPSAPCLTVSPDTVDFGTVPFANTSVPSGADSQLTATNCGSADQLLNASATNASGPSGSWTLSNQPDSSGNPCLVPAIDTYYLRISGGIDVLYLGTAASPVRSGGAAAVFPGGSAVPVLLRIYMPCEGSNGAGQQKSLTATFMAVLA